MNDMSSSGLAKFLVEAKRHTYAGLDDDATITTPLLPGSKQLEHRVGNLLYRDIYFGMGFFVGQETVQAGERVIWSMSYAGSVSSGITNRDELLAIYAFLRKALLAVEEALPFRGPAQFADVDFRYINTPQGDLAEFHGGEEVHRAGSKVYALRYQGGMIR
jgi:hypothetical protein